MEVRAEMKIRHDKEGDREQDRRQERERQGRGHVTPLI